ncbi:cache domain-containing protein [Anoxynatronum buryatiense]|uniref:Single Cache domain 2-containing protein n=1 Tax=Anoxynatronum buryatiense TaxID=489973 RepID=A0AA45WZG0_9CLOT|nr:cache domain-containing protein [Anoxynatronum buryatiense]SMP67941.1 Single Cache domain 2-containing protein [Anoxynatronum buryatiense]
MTERLKLTTWLYPIVIPLILFILFNTFYSAPLLKRSMISEKESQIEDLTNLGISILSHFHSMEMDGKLTRSQAQGQATSLIRDLRFGPEGKDYYWINDKTPTLVVHPFRPDLERVDLEGEATGEFLDLFENFVTIAESRQEGFTRYQWQYYDEADRMESKISYIKYFEPWEWIIGTGLYIDDVEKAAQSQRNINVIFVITVLQLLLAGFVLYKLLMKRK